MTGHNNNKGGFASQLLGYLPHLLTIITIIIGIIQYNKNTEKDIRKEFFYKQVNAYEKLTDKVTFMIYHQCKTTDSSKLLLNEYIQFRHGAYSLYTTDSVEKYASTFELFFDRYLKKDAISQRELEVISYKLSNQCRVSLNQTLDVNLDKITFRQSLK